MEHLQRTSSIAVLGLLGSANSEMVHAVNLAMNEKLSRFSVQKNENLSGLHLGINLMYCIL